MKKVINKGYTITVVSWENDGDNYNTKSMTVDTKEEASKIVKICKELFQSENVGNSMNGEASDIIEKYIQDNQELQLDTDYISDLVMYLMGYSEYYDYRVCEEVTVTYSDKDIYLEEITF